VKVRQSGKTSLSGVQCRDSVEFWRWFYLRINMNSQYYDGNMRGVVVFIL
jgi:hypothetical protein